LALFIKQELYPVIQSLWQQDEKLTKQTSKLVKGLEERATKTNIPLTTNQAGAMFGFFFTEENNISTFEQVSACDAERFKKFYHGMLEQGIYLAPSAYETGFVSSTHSDDDQLPGNPSLRGSIEKIFFNTNVAISNY